MYQNFIASRNIARTARPYFHFRTNIEIDLVRSYERSGSLEFEMRNLGLGDSYCDARKASSYAFMCSITHKDHF